MFAVLAVGIVHTALNGPLGGQMTWLQGCRSSVERDSGKMDLRTRGLVMTDLMRDRGRHA